MFPVHPSDDRGGREGGREDCDHLMIGLGGLGREGRENSGEREGERGRERGEGRIVII